MPRNFFFLLLLTLLSSSAHAVELSVKSLRTTLSKPDTSHELLFQPTNSPEQKSVFILEPVKQERLGLFLDINGFEIGYSEDISHSTQETDTLNIILSYRKLRHGRISYNYQKLEGLAVEAESINSTDAEQRFLPGTTSTKHELFGLHNLHTFGGGESLFEHFFLNKPVLSDSFDVHLSIVGSWSIKHLSLESPSSIIFSPSYLESPAVPVDQLNSISGNVNLGPMISINMPNNFNFFTEYKAGIGYIRNTSTTNGLKNSGDEKSRAVGAGLSWTSANKQHLVLLRGWNQKGRHIDVSFGDLSYVYFF